MIYHIDPPNSSDTKGEIAHQVSFRTKVRNAAPQVILAAVPNSGRRTAWEKVERSREGMVPGFPDMLAFHGGRVAALEFKSGKGSLSAAQKEVLNRLHNQRIPVGVFRTGESAFEWLAGLWPDAFTQGLAA